MFASGSTRAWFLAPPRACTRLPASVARWCTYLAMGVEPTKLTAAMPGWSRMASTATLSPWTTLNTPSGSPASAYSRAMKLDADGSRSLGLSTNVFPVAIAIGCIQIGTMAGKLNGVMPATDAERLPERVRVHVGGDLLGVLTLEQGGDAARELDHLQAAGDLALGVGDDLAVLVRDELGQLVEVLLDELAEGEHDAGPADERHVAPLVERLPGRRHRGVHVGRLGQRHLGLLGAGGGVVDRAVARRGAGRLRPG